MDYNCNYLLHRKVDHPNQFGGILTSLRGWWTLKLLHMMVPFSLSLSFSHSEDLTCLLGCSTTSQGSLFIMVGGGFFQEWASGFSIPFTFPRPLKIAISFFQGWMWTLSIMKDESQEHSNRNFLYMEPSSKLSWFWCPLNSQRYILILRT